MKLFTVSDANAMLPTVRGIVGRISRAHGRVMAVRDEAKLAAEAGAESGGGGIQGGGAYVAALVSLAESVNQLEALGVQLKDYERGLVDFPSLREGKVVLLCWQLGEGDRIEWWHDLEAGFAGRQPL